MAINVWLKLNTQWRDALQKAETNQHSLDVQIKHYFDGLGDKPAVEEIIETTSSWEAEFFARQQLFDFLNLKGLVGKPSAIPNQRSNTKAKLHLNF
jgi:hypothetical protein